MRAYQLRTIGIAASAALLLAACPLPLPRGYWSDARANVPETAPDSIKKGETTREDVLMQFGEPDTVAVDETWIEYGSSYSLGGVVFVLPSGENIGAAGAVRVRYRRMIIEFDPQGVTTEVILESSKCFQYFAGMTGTTRTDHDAGGETKPCLDQFGMDVPEKFHLPDVRK
ncbi:hypothetical protein PTE30175_04030 [Pandoraea terrae]|uniref:Lipoprotein n=1 Tax=Pandoraea terrae TaxID=1537710 RepID=A0A5E4XWQ9_9BURK|nr:hypothetical protein [Pandoraea terrae]VVE40485.1 hypothetical protein PTE30175_04030 [Pandoraea terrae]